MKIITRYLYTTLSFLMLIKFKAVIIFFNFICRCILLKGRCTICTKGHFRTKTLLHVGSLLRNDIFARLESFIFNFYYHCYLKPYPKSVTYFSSFFLQIFFFKFLSVIFSTTVTLTLSRYFFIFFFSFPFLSFFINDFY